MDLSAIPAFDQHAHNVLRAEAAARLPFAAAFSEAQDPDALRHVPETLCYRRSLRDLAELLGCEATEAAVTERRAQLGLEELTRRSFAAANLEMILLDDGFLEDAILPVEWHAQFVPARRLLRLETLAQRLLPASSSFSDFVDRYRSEITAALPHVAGLKSIAAYRSGLDVRPVERAAAAERFIAIRHDAGAPPHRLTDKALIDFLLLEALELAAPAGVPVQFHTGFGDPDLDLRLANPLHLRWLLEQRRLRGAPVVLLHASYPFAREAGYLASVYPQVHVDFGLAVPLLSASGMRDAVRQLLELAPWSKVLYSSDARLIPETYYLAALRGRQVLGEVLASAASEGDLTANEADLAAVAILRDNARTLYRLER
jgi:uncharacterized protein